HVEIRQLVEDFARYLYLPRLADPSVLLGAVVSGISSLSWQIETFAYAESYDDVHQRYRGLNSGCNISVTDPDTDHLLVEPTVAVEQKKKDAEIIGTPTEEPKGGPDDPNPPTPPEPSVKAAPKRFFGSVQLDPLRVGRDAGQIAE